MTCDIIPGTGFVRLIADDIDPSVLDLSCGLGWSVEQLQIGFPAVRPVVRNRALDDGAFDETTFVGQRAVTLTVRFDGRQFMQGFIDQIMPFVSPRRRPQMQYQLSGSGDVRTLSLRGVDAPVVIDGPSYQAVSVSWVSTESYARGSEEKCVTLETSSEEGRTYDLTFDRVYGSSSFVASTSVNVVGNVPSPWVVTIFADVTDPAFRINGVEVSFTGVSLAGGATLVIDAEARTMLLDGDPTQSVFGDSNFFDWTWDDLYLRPGENLIEYLGSPLDASSMTLCYYDRYL